MSDSNKCWLRTDKDHGEGDGTYKLIFEENRSDVPQTAVVEIVSEDGSIVKEISVTQSPRKVYLSAMKQKVFTKNDCMADERGSEVLYVVPSGQYKSYISQEDADAQAERDLNEYGQDYANANGTCEKYIWYNDEMRATLKRNNCPAGAEGSSVTYIVREGKHSSLVSKDDANRKAQEDIDLNAQAYANENGTCPSVAVYQSKEVRAKARRNNCEDGATGEEVEYVVPAGKYTSTVSQADADAKAEADADANAQNYANEHGTCSSVYWNVEKAGNFQKNDCEEGQNGSVVKYTVPAHTVSSTISQADADAKAAQKVQDEGQAYANEHGTCSSTTLYSSSEVRVKKTRNNCQAGYTGTEVEYVVEAGKYTSSVSQEDADAQARADADANAQAYANEHGECTPPTTYENAELRTTLRKNDCSDGMKGTSATYVVPAGKYTSTVSQADADAKAQADSDANAQNWVNENGSCVDVFENAEIRQVFTKNDCSGGMVGSDVEYVVDAGKYVSEVSQEDADAQAQADVDANGQSYANKNGHCLYGNDRKSQMFTRNNCGADGVGSEVEYVVEENTFKSEESKEAANALADADIAANGQNYANEHGTCTELFKNVEMSEDFQKNDCGNGMKGSTVTYTVPAGKHSSIVSVDAANAKAREDIEENGQAYANEHGECIDLFLSNEIREEVQKNDCGDGMAGSMVEYVVDAGKYTSEVSQADADKQAQDDFNENAQAYANKNGHCLYINDEKSQSFTRNNCGEGYEGTSVVYVVPAGKYQSEESKEAANALADADIAANGQAHANTEGQCLKLYYNVQKSGVFTPECPSGQVADNYTYVVPAGKYTSTVSQADADKKAQDDVNANGQAEANENAECRDLYTSVEKQGTFYRDNCGTCHHGDAYVYVVEAGKYTSSVSQADADSQAQADVNENGQAAANKNGTCSADSTSATWTDTGSTQCNGCTSQKQQRDTNSCSSTYNETRWVNGGGRSCSDWEYYGSGDCDGHTQYDAYRDSCSGSVNNRYSVSCSNCCNCGSYQATSEYRCLSGSTTKQRKYVDDCGNVDWRTYQTNSPECGGCSCSLTVSDVSFDHSGGTKKSAVSSSCGSNSISYTASSNQSWCTVSVVSGGVNVTCSANSSYSSRSATVTVTQNGSPCNSSKSFTVSQSGKPNDYVFTFADGATGTKTYSATAAGGNAQYTITSTKNGSSQGWSASSGASWLTASKNGNVITISIQSNATTSSRTGSVTLTQDESGKTLTVSVTQPGTNPQPTTGTLQFCYNSNNSSDPVSATFSASLSRAGGGSESINANIGRGACHTVSLTPGTWSISIDSIRENSYPMRTGLCPGTCTYVNGSSATSFTITAGRTTQVTCTPDGWS